MTLEKFIYSSPFELESGEQLPSLEIAYHTYGTLNSEKSNVLWVCHALTANSDVADWWSGLFGQGKALDPERYFIICANIPGSCYGSSGPLSINPATGKPYYSTFPQLTIRDMVKAHILLRKHLGIDSIYLGIGGSMGGYQLLEWALMEPVVFANMVMLTTSARETAWGIAIHTAQRLAIEADPTWNEPRPDAGAKGLKAARAIGMLTYRNYEIFVKNQSDEEQKLDGHKASSYILYQGDKLVKRYNAVSYWVITKAQDTHSVGRGRGKIEDVLGSIRTRSLVIGISSDILCPTAEQKFLAKHMANAAYKEIHSEYGHDGFLIEWEQLNSLIASFLSKK